MKRSLVTILLAGTAFGVLNLLHYFISTQLEGVNMPFGLFPGGLPVAITMGITGKGLSTELIAMSILGIGIMAGAFLDAKLSGDLTLEKFTSKKLSGPRSIRAFGGGILMGSGIWMAQGCLIKHTLSGLPGLMISSFLTLGGIVAGIWLSSVVEERWIR